MNYMIKKKYEAGKASANNSMAIDGRGSVAGSPHARPIPNVPQLIPRTVNSNVIDSKTPNNQPVLGKKNVESTMYEARNSGTRSLS